MKHNTDNKTATACQKTPDTASVRLRFAQLERRELNDVRQQRDIATAQLALCKLHAAKLAEALRDCLEAYSGDNYYDIEGKVAAAQEAREALAAYEEAKQ